MKTLFFAIVAALVLTQPILAQAPNNAGAINVLSTNCAAATASGCVALQFNPETSGVVIQISQTFSATLQFESTLDGVNWTAVAGTPIGGGAAVTSATSTGIWQFGVTGLTGIRVRCSAYTSGQAGVFIQAATQGSTMSSGVMGNITGGFQKVQVVDPNGNVLPTTPSGTQNAANSDSIVQASDQNFRVVKMPASATGVTTYVAAGSATLASSPFDFSTLTGNGTTVTFLTKVTVSCTQTTAGIAEITLIRRSSVDTGGVTVTLTAVPQDPSDAAANSAAKLYTTGPTAFGTAVGNLDDQRVGLMAPATATANDIYIWTADMGKAPMLRTAAQQLALSFNGTSMSGAICGVRWEWIEQ